MNWFFASGDAPFFYSEQLSALSIFPSLWNGSINYGGSNLASLWLDYPFRLVTLIFIKIGFSWFVIDKFWWVLVFIGSIYGAYSLGKYYGLQKKYALISSIIYSTNTYILMVFDGGQLGVALAYAFFPLILKLTIAYLKDGFNKKNVLSETIKLGLALSFYVLLDIRFTYIFFLSSFIYCTALIYKKQLRIPIQIGLIPLIIISINMYWILPTLLFKESLSNLSILNTSANFLSFFSVADFTHATSLLHPNYPENLFGRVYLFKTEFLLLPIFAYSYFLIRRKQLTIVVLGVLAILGIFLGKGVQEPFGQLYAWSYKYIPGFVMFRDPTKWYVLVALVFSILIPLSLRNLTESKWWVNNIFYKQYKLKNLLNFGVIFLFVVYWCFLSRYLFSGLVNGNLRPPILSKDYISLKDMLISDETAGRVLWLPNYEQFAYSSALHPRLDSFQLNGESSITGILRNLQDQSIIEKMKLNGIGYVAVPEDSKQRIFLNNYKYDANLKKQIVAELNNNSNLSKIDIYDNLNIYKLRDYKNFFTLGNDKIKSKIVNNEWILEVPKLETEKTLFALLAYEPNWRLIIRNQELIPNKDNAGFMSFELPIGNEDEGRLTYLPNSMARIGTFISFVALLIITGIGILVFKNKK